MNAPLTNISQDVRALVSAEEWDARVSIPECFNNMFWLKRSCDLQVMALSCNMKLRKVSDEVIDKTWRAYQPGGRRHNQQKRGLLEWPALLHELDRIDPLYKT